MEPSEIVHVVLDAYQAGQTEKAVIKLLLLFVLNFIIISDSENLNLVYLLTVKHLKDFFGKFELIFWKKFCFRLVLFVVL